MRPGAEVRTNALVPVPTPWFVSHEPENYPLPWFLSHEPPNAERKHANVIALVRVSRTSQRSETMRTFTHPLKKSTIKSKAMKKKRKTSHTSEAIASKAARMLRNPKTPARYRSVIASALCQSRGRKT